MPDLLAHQHQYPERWQTVDGPGKRPICWLPVWVNTDRQPDLGLNGLGDWMVPTGDGLVPVHWRPVVLLPLLHLERDDFKEQLSARLQELKLPALPLTEPLVLLTLKAGLSSKSDFWEVHALKWLRPQDITEGLLDLVMHLKEHGCSQNIRHQALHFLKQF